jgi:hypothetical protein
MGIDAVSSADFIQDGTIGEEKGEGLYEDKASEISSFARERIEERTSPRAQSLKPVIILCRGHDKQESSPYENDQKSDKKGEWGGDLGVHARSYQDGKEVLNFEARGSYKDFDSKSKTDVTGSVNIDKNGKVYGEIGVERHW